MTSKKFTLLTKFRKVFTKLDGTDVYRKTITTATQPCNGVRKKPKTIRTKIRSVKKESLPDRQRARREPNEEKADKRSRRGEFQAAQKRTK